jgi:protein SDA1
MLKEMCCIFHCVLFTVELDLLVVVVAQACHELVPPDAMTAVLRQLVDAFVHDRARPEVMTLGLKTVRELCARMPLIMTPELLQVTTSFPGAQVMCAWPVTVP